MGARPDPDRWCTSQVAGAIGDALLDAPHELTAKELEEPTGRSGDQSNLKKKARELAGEGLLTVVRNPPRRNRIGRPAEEAFILNDEQRQLAEGVLRPKNAPAPARQTRRAPSPSERQAADSSIRSSSVGSLARGQEIVIADVAGARLAEMMQALADAEDECEATWTALCGDEYLFVFEGEDPAAGATRLLSVLDGARVPVRQAPVRRVTSVATLADEARQAARGRRKARMRSDTQGA